LPALLAETFSWLEQTRFANEVRIVPHLYPVLMSVHVLGIALMIGSAFIVDLRLMGYGRGTIPVTVVARSLLPLSRAGFFIVLVTGLTMFAAVAFTVGSSGAARWKLVLIILAGLNILLFHGGVFRGVAAWDLHAPTPVSAKVAAFMSMVAWTGVIFAGRFLAYS